MHKSEIYFIIKNLQFKLTGSIETIQNLEKFALSLGSQKLFEGVYTLPKDEDSIFQKYGELICSSY